MFIPTVKDLAVAGALLRLSIVAKDDPTISSTIVAEAARVAATHGAEATRHWINGVWYVKGTEIHGSWRAVLRYIDGEVA